MIAAGLGHELHKKRSIGMFRVVAFQHTYDGAGFIAGTAGVDWINIIAGTGWLVAAFIELKIM